MRGRRNPRAERAARLVPGTPRCRFTIAPQPQDASGRPRR